MQSPSENDSQRYTRAMGEKATSVEEYLNALDPACRAELERIRALVTRLVPGTEETISYGMPTLKYRNRALVYFTASKKHMSFYPSSWAIEELRDKLTDYKTTEHAIQFTLEKTLPSALVEDLVRVHVREIDADRQ
ncbi:iron chaperone [Paeniglutamicibacter kerguelensis]